jgi:hypothetical protein
MQYKPKRSSARWLQGAPREVLAIYFKSSFELPFTVLYDDAVPYHVPPHSDRDVAVTMYCVGADGRGYHDHIRPWAREGLGRKVAFHTLPDAVQRAVIDDCRDEAEGAS